MVPSRRFAQSELAAVERVLESQVLWRGNGPLWSGAAPLDAGAVDRFEDSFARWLGAPYAHAVNTGTSANEAAVSSLGLPPGSEVLCPSASPVFVPMAILAAGCVPVFVDVDPRTMLLDPDGLEERLTAKTRAIVVVHLWGRPAAMDAILAFARTHDLFVIEDCAQAAFTLLHGNRLGTFGDVACFSLQQAKLISSGEGGVVTTADPTKYARAVLYSNTGIPSFRHGISLADVGLEENGVQSFGHNHRMAEVQAAVASAQLERVDEFIEGRRRAVSYLRMALEALGDERLIVDDDPEDCEVSYWRLPVSVPEGFGDYVGIPQQEPVFARMNRERTTPFGYPLPDYIDYSPRTFRGALEGARRTRVLMVDPLLTEAGAREVIGQRLRIS